MSPKGVASAAVDKDFALFVAYDALDRVVRQTSYDTSGATPKAVNTHFCYDLAGDLTSVTAPKADAATVDCAAPPAFTTKYTYDAAHRTKTATDPLGHKRSVTYDPNGNVDTRTDPDGIVTTSFFDQRDLLIRQETPFTSTRKLVARMEYDGAGNVVRRISPRAHDSALASLITTMTYDRVNRLVKVALPYKGAETPSFIHRDYDDNGNLTKTTLADSAATLAGVPLDKVTDVTYFDTGWVRTSHDHVNPKVTFDYRAEGMQSSRTPEGDETELWTYYDDGMIKEHKDRAGHPVEYFYDANDNLTKAVDRTGLFEAGSKPIDVRVTYDTLDQVEKVRHRKEGDTSTNFKFATFRYDLNGNMSERADGGVETDTGTQVTAPKRHRFTYDGADWLTMQEDFLADGCQKINNTFTSSGLEATRVVRKATQACDDPSAAFQARQSTEWAYFLNGKLKKLTTRKGDLASPIVEQHDVDYLQDGVYVNGHRTKDVFFRSSPGTGAPCTSAAAPCTAAYTYDGRDRLVREDKGHGTATDYTLDTAGNVTQKTSGTSSLFYSYRGNQLQTVASGTQANVGAKYFYDPLGNVDCIASGGYSGTSCSGTSSSNLLQDYAYDPLERLISVTGYSGGTKTDSAEYSYDALDRVTSQKESHGIGGTSATSRTTDFSHLGLSNLVTREDVSGDSKSASKTYSYDAYGHRISMTDDPKDQTKPDETYTYAYDVHGSVSMLLDKAGTVKASYGYTAYGEKDGALTNEGAGVDDKDPLNAYRYTAKRFDSGSGTLDMGARRFAPDTGRFLQDDVYRGALSNLALATDPLTQNRYSLAGGNPLSFVEVDGHMVVADGGGGAATSPNFQTADSYASAGAGMTGNVSTMGPFNPDLESVEFSWGSVGVSAGMGMYGGGSAIAKTGTDAGKTLAKGAADAADLSKAGSRLADLRWNPQKAAVGQTFRNPAFAKVGTGLTVLGAGMSIYGNINEDGNSVSDMVVESAVEIGVGYAAGLATAAVCAATAVVGCLAAGAVIGIASGFIGAGLGEVASAGVDWFAGEVSREWDAAGEALSSAGEAIGDGLEAAGDFLGGLF